MSLNSKTPPPLRVVDLFSGASGFGLGAEWAGARVVASFDKDPDLTATHHINLPHSDLHITDLASVDAADFATWVHQRYGRIDGVIGGPPCQGFSEIGRRAPDDIRNALLIRYAEIVAALKPKFFILENVPGILFPGARDLLSRAQRILSEEFLLCDPTTLVARNFGVPTSRKRVFIAGAHRSLCTTPEVELLAEKERSRLVTVRQAISDLPSPTDIAWTAHRGSVWSKYRLHGSSVSAYAKAMRRLPMHEISCPETASKIQTGQVSGCRATKHTKSVAARFEAIHGGGVDSISKCPRLHWEGLCPTLRAGTGPERGSYQAIRPIHPREPRVITVREAARLQGFPDWFQFHATNWHAFRMIGNSIPPLMAKAVIRHVIERVAEQRGQSGVGISGRQQIA